MSDAKKNGDGAAALRDEDSEVRRIRLAMAQHFDEALGQSGGGVGLQARTLCFDWLVLISITFDYFRLLANRF